MAIYSSANLGCLSATCGLLICFLVTSAKAAYNERNYVFGDDPREGTVAAGLVIGTAPGNLLPGFTIDKGDGVPELDVAGTFVSLEVVGNPTYVLSDRPGADPGSFAASFDGTGDRLWSLISVNSPNRMWAEDTFWGDGNSYPRNYRGLFSNAVQLWVKPGDLPANPDAGMEGEPTYLRQDVFFDTDQRGAYISGEGTWGFEWDGDNSVNLGPSSRDTQIPVTTNEWHHLQHISGPQTVGSRATSSLGGVLLLNGVAIAGLPSFYDNQSSNTGDTELSIGGARTGSEGGEPRSFNGVIDDFRIALWGDNSGDLGNDDAPGISPGVEDSADGFDYGILDLNENNDWIANKLAELNVTSPGDVNVDGQLTSADVDILVDNWQTSFAIVPTPASGSEDTTFTKIQIDDVGTVYGFVNGGLATLT